MDTNTIKENSNKNEKSDDHEESNDHEESDEDGGHDEDECDSSGHCNVCCKLSRCTTKDTWARQGQYECNKGMYFPCTICEPQFKGMPQSV